MKKLVLPARAYGRKLVYEFPVRIQGHEFKLFLRNELKRTPMYYTPIELDKPVAGRTDEGIPIPINTLGRWLFGVPGYAGNAAFDGFSVPPKVVVNIGADTPDDTIRVIDELLLIAGGVRREKQNFS